MQSSFRTENFQLGIVYYCNLAVSYDLLFINIKQPIEQNVLSAVFFFIINKFIFAN